MLGHLPTPAATSAAYPTVATRRGRSPVESARRIQRAHEKRKRRARRNARLATSLLRRTPSAPTMTVAPPRLAPPVTRRLLLADELTEPDFDLLGAA